MSIDSDHIPQLAAAAYFFALWWGYGYYARKRAQRGTRLSLSRELRTHRELWSTRMLMREMRMTDASLLANQERVVAFFASTTLIILAAILTAISSSAQISELLQQLPWVAGISETAVFFKLLVLLLIMVYAFFKATWSLRQYGFASALIGSAPMIDEAVSAEERRRFAENLARLMDRAGHDNNGCLRAYYFAFAIVFWAAGDLPFVIATSVVVLILADREFRSAAVVCIRDAQVPVAPLSRDPTGLQSQERRDVP